MLRIGGGNQLEVEALSQPHLTMWSMTIQRIVVSRSQGKTTHHQRAQRSVQLCLLCIPRASLFDEP